MQNTFLTIQTDQGFRSEEIETSVCLNVNFLREDKSKDFMSFFLFFFFFFFAISEWNFQ